MSHPIYLDHNASTPIDPIVLKAMFQEMEQEEGNPSSVHSHGRRCRQILEHARETLARFLNVKSQELLFTSGGTEGANLLIQGFMNQNPSCHVITSNAEHSCVYNTLKRLSQKTGAISFLPTHLWGAVQPDAVLNAIQPNTGLIVLMAVNNETGIKTDISAIAAIALEKRIPFIVDGVALLGKEPFSIPPGVTAMFFSGHKLHGPKGVGFVFCRQSFKFPSFMCGGSQEFNRRPGTENLPGIVGLSAAVTLLEIGQKQFTDHMKNMCDRLETGLKSNLNDIIVNGEGPRVANTLNVSFPGIDGESLLMALDLEKISVSHGSACSSGSIEPSRILLNMGIPLIQARSAIRFSVSRKTTPEEIDRCVESLMQIVKRMQALK